MEVTMKAPISSYQRLEPSQICAILDPSFAGLARHEEKKDHLEDPGVDGRILSIMNANRVGFFSF